MLSAVDLLRYSDGVIRPRVLAPQDPAAGADVSVTVPGGRVWIPQTAYYELVTDATVANRQGRLLLDDGETVFWEHQPPNTQAASLARQYVYGRGVGIPGAIAGSLFPMPLPEVYLFPGFRIRTTITNLQAADNIGSFRMYVIELDLVGGARLAAAIADAES